MPHRPPSEVSDTTIDTPPLSPSSATRSSVASTNSSVSLGELSFRSSRKFVHDSVMFSGGREGDIQEELDADTERGTRSMDRGRAGHDVNRDHPERISRPRPQIPRQSSYSKRHSSFDTPREVPFPYGYLEHPGGQLPDHSGPSGDAKHERSAGVPPSPGDSSRCIEGIQNAACHPLANSVDGSANGDPSPPHRPNLERSSTTSLPLPTSTSYFALPRLPSSGSPPCSDGLPPPPMALTTTAFGSSPSLDSSPRTTSFNHSVSKLELPQLASPSSATQSSRLPDSPPVIADEADLYETARSTDAQTSFLHPPSSQDARPHISLPPPPKFLSSLSFTSSPALRSMSYPQLSDNVSHTGSQSLSGASPFPPPEPPTILTPSDAEEEERKPAPYQPFLPRDQPPPDHTYIVVETIPGEYRLIVRLPGFQRDAITLAMRRRRVLHVVADNWSDGGGHFERRIAFGYDADVGSVRAEFDGEILRIIVPRREPPGWFAPPGQ